MACNLRRVENFLEKKQVTTFVYSPFMLTLSPNFLPTASVTRTKTAGAISQKSKNNQLYAIASVSCSCITLLPADACGSPFNSFHIWLHIRSRRYINLP